jgi:RAQPRD family integrative conjugative element protein
MKEKMYLTQILNQIDAMQPLIIAAEKSQPSNTRIKFHYIRYRDSHGNLHNGLLEDIQAIKSGITQKLNDTSVEPRIITPIKGDYLEN